MQKHLYTFLTFLPPLMFKETENAETRRTNVEYMLKCSCTTCTSLCRKEPLSAYRNIRTCTQLLSSPLLIVTVMKEKHTKHDKGRKGKTSHVYARNYSNYTYT